MLPAPTTFEFQALSRIPVWATLVWAVAVVAGWLAPVLLALQSAAQAAFVPAAVSPERSKSEIQKLAAHLSHGDTTAMHAIRVLQYAAVCCSVLQCAAVCCNVLN